MIIHPRVPTEGTSRRCMQEATATSPPLLGTPTGRLMPAPETLTAFLGGQ